MRLHMQSALYAITRPSVRLSDTRVDQSKTVTLGSCNFHHTVAQSLQFLRYEFNPEILTGSPELGRQTRVGRGKQFSSFMRRYLENGTRYDQSYY